MRRVLSLLVVLPLLTGCASGGPQDDTALITAFADAITHACSSGGSQACATNRLDHAYPGALNHDAAEKCIAALQDDPKAKYSIIVAAESISKDASWGGPVDTAADWLFAGQKPEGTTYTMKATISTNYLGQDNTVTWDTHMTVRDGVVYWYPKIC